MVKVTSKILYGIFVLLLIGVAGIFLASLLPIPGNIELKIVKSGSMEPTIKTGAVVLVKPSSIYKVGDIITFGEDSTSVIPTTHRIISIRESGQGSVFMTKGDANEEEDPQEVLVSEVIGKVLINIPFTGYVLDFARKPLGFTLLIGVPASVIILDETTRIFGEVAAIRRRRKEKIEEIQETSYEN